MIRWYFNPNDSKTNILIYDPKGNYKWGVFINQKLLKKQLHDLSIYNRVKFTSQVILKEKLNHN